MNNLKAVESNGSKDFMTTLDHTSIIPNHSTGMGKSKQDTHLDNKRRIK